MIFYREANGDYCAIDPTSAAYYRRIGKPDTREGRATAIEGNVGSVCTTGIDLGYLRKGNHDNGRAKRVRRAEVPKEWRLAIEGRF